MKNTFELYADQWADAQPKDHIVGVTLGTSLYNRQQWSSSACPDSTDLTKPVTKFI